MAFREMSNIGQGFAAKLERQAKRILEGEVIIGEELDMLNYALGQWMEEVSRLQAQAKARNEAQHQAPHERANIHDQVSTQMHANLGQTTIEIRLEMQHSKQILTGRKQIYYILRKSPS